LSLFRYSDFELRIFGDEIFLAAANSGR